MASSDEYETYYHHTDLHSAEEIFKSGCILQSSGKQNARYGDGTYLEKKLGPDSTRREVGINNYDGHTPSYWEGKVKDGKADVTFEVSVLKSKVTECKAGTRDVHLYKGDLKLADAQNVCIHWRDKDGKHSKEKTYSPPKF